MIETRNAARRRSARTARLSLGIGLLLGMSAMARAQTKALTLAEVLDLRRQGVSTRQILRNARTYCISFVVDDSSRRALGAGGADSGLVTGLGDVCSTESVRRRSVTLIDDDFVHTLAQSNAWSDHRCASRVEDGVVRIENKRTDAICLLRYPSAALSGTLRIELSVSDISRERDGDGELALGFGMGARTMPYFALQITSKGRVQLCWMVDGGCGPLLTLMPAEGTAKSTAGDVYAIELHGREIGVYANSERVGTYVAGLPVTGQIAIGIGAMTTAKLSRLRVSVID